MGKQTDMPTSERNEINDLSRTIGGLEQAIKSLQESVLYHQSSSEQGRRRLYEKFERLDDSVNQEMRTVTGTVTTLTARVDSLAARIDVIEPIAMTVKDQRLRLEGAQKFGHLVWSMVIGAAGAIGWAVHEMATMLLHRPPGP